MRITLCTALLFVSVFCVAQQTFIGDEYLFNRLTTKDGLSIDEVNFVFQDSRGFIWIGTTDGLNLYTANNIIVFRNDPKDSLTLPDNNIFSMVEDKNGNLWVGSGTGLTRMNLNSWKIEKVFRQRKDSKSISNSVVIFLDSENKLWTANIGIDLYDPLCDCFHHYVNQCHTDEKEYRASNLIHALFQDSNGRVWAGTNYGVYQFDLITKKFFKPYWFTATALKKNETIGPIVTEIMEDHSGQIWMATWGYGLVKFLPDESRFVINRIKEPGTQKLTFYNVVDRVAESQTADGKFHLWVGTDNGFGEWDEAAGQFLLHRPKPSDYGPVSKIYTDRSGLVWICTQNSGIFVLDPYRQIFRTINFDFKTTSPAIKFGEINSIMSEADTIWITTWYGNALYKLDRNFNLLAKWRRFPTNDLTDESYQGNHVSRDRQGYLWMTTLAGLHRLNTRTNEVKSFRHKENDPTSLPSDKVVKYFQDSEGIRWVCFYKGGICKLDGDGKVFDLSNGLIQEGRIFKFNVWDIVEDDEQNVWFADDALGLWKYDRKKKKLIEPSEKALTGHFGALARDGKTIWASSGNGLVKIHGDSVQLFTMANGLPSNSVYGAQTDNEKRLWVLTSQGLACFDADRRTIRVFKREDGLEETKGIVFQKLSNGSMMLGAWNYVTVFDPSKIVLNKNIPLIHLTRFRVFGKPFAWTTVENEKKIILDYTQNQFSFDFAVLNYSNPRANKFFYKMEGFNKDWVSSTQGFANYTNLDAGTYTFRVKGSNADGTMNDIGDYVIIRIVPPFWKTWWFNMLCAVVVSGVIYFVYRVRLNQLLRLERLRTKISTDLHDDMGSTLSSISILSNLALKANDSAKQSMLGEISDNSITLMERMDDIVWSINPRNDSFDRLLVRVQNFASKLFEAKGIDYQIDVPQNISSIKLSMENRQHVYLIMREAINNLVKYSECKTVRIKVSVAPLIIEITDDGKGFDVDSTNYGNGIQSMRGRARQMQAGLNIISKKGAGTTVSIVKIK